MARERNESPEYLALRDLALEQLRKGKSLTGSDGVFAPILKEFLESALDSELESHLDENERYQGNKRNGRKSKTLKTSSGEIRIDTPQDRQSSFEPQIVKKKRNNFGR